MFTDQGLGRCECSQTRGWDTCACSQTRGWGDVNVHRPGTGEMCVSQTKDWGDVKVHSTEVGERMYMFTDQRLGVGEL